MVFDGSYQLNLDDNRGVASWVIHCKDTYNYEW